MVEQFFKNLIEIEGVEAVILFDNRNNILDSWTVSQYPSSSFTDVGSTFLHVFGLMEYLAYNIQELVIPYDNGIIYSRNYPQFFIVVMLKLNIEIPFIRLAINISQKEFINNRKINKLFKKKQNKKSHHIKSITLDDVEKIMLKNILGDNNVS